MFVIDVIGSVILRDVDEAVSEVLHALSLLDSYAWNNSQVFTRRLYVADASWDTLAVFSEVVAALFFRASTWDSITFITFHTLIMTHSQLKTEKV